MRSTGDELFGFIASKIQDMVPECVNAAEPYPLGFTFSFPVDQTSLKTGTLIHWTKGFNAEDCVGQDVVALLQRALVKRNIKINVVALVNDTAGTQIAQSLVSRDCYMVRRFPSFFGSCAPHTLHCTGPHSRDGHQRVLL